MIVAVELSVTVIVLAAVEACPTVNVWLAAEASVEAVGAGTAGLIETPMMAHGFALLRLPS